tara:strand:+ start:750 stop:923 length:174 start_codon:yes stop_codon:yes gene_type:complete
MKVPEHSQAEFNTRRFCKLEITNRIFQTIPGCMDLEQEKEQIDPHSQIGKRQLLLFG